MIKTKTFDLLDAEYTREVVDYLSLDDKLRFKNSEETFILDPNYWEKYYRIIDSYNCNFNWQEFKFDSRPDLNSIITSNDIGVYMFIIKPNNLIYGNPSYIIYVGISGEKGSNRPLKDRIGDYLNYNNINKRKKLHRLLSKYYGEAHVAYSLVQIPWQDLEKVEEALHGFFMPIANDRDFPVGIKSIKKSF